MNIGGRPLASWTDLYRAVVRADDSVFGADRGDRHDRLNGLPQPYHPVFNVERFSMASSDKFFLVSNHRSAFRQRPRRFLEGTGAKGVYDVEE